ncbi:MAG: hypothetical protein ACR2IP_13560 [Solirubrobacteraceae bacterium]
MPVGIVVLIVGGGPAWIGVALIVAGILITRQLNSPGTQVQGS